MNNILLLFTIVLFNVLPSSTETKFCDAVLNKRELAEFFYGQLTTSLNQYKNIQTIAQQTMAYLQNTDNKNQLLAGGDSCEKYLTDLKTAMKNDGRANRLSAGFVQQKIYELVDQKLDQIV